MTRPRNKTLSSLSDASNTEDEHSPIVSPTVTSLPDSDEENKQAFSSDDEDEPIKDFEQDDLPEFDELNIEEIINFMQENIQKQLKFIKKLNQQDPLIANIKLYLNTANLT